MRARQAGRGRRRLMAARGVQGRAGASARIRRFTQVSADTERGCSRVLRLAFWATSLTWLAWGVFSKHLTSCARLSSSCTARTGSSSSGVKLCVVL